MLKSKELKKKAKKKEVLEHVENIKNEVNELIGLYIEDDEEIGDAAKEIINQAYPHEASLEDIWANWAQMEYNIKEMME